jgi:hypothetical protein
MQNLEVGDEIVEINGKSLENCGLDDVIKIFSLSLVVDMKVVSLFDRLTTGIQWHQAILRA